MMRGSRSSYGERDLWLDVVILALRDALMPHKEVRRRDVVERNRNRQAADEWIRERGPDYELVCSLAAIDSSELHRRYVAGEITFESLTTPE